MQDTPPSPADVALIRSFDGKPAPLLPMLHRFHERDGYLSHDALKAIAKETRMSLADLFGTVTFYHHFRSEPDSFRKPRVCTGPICSLHGSRELLQALLPEGATSMPCAGRCDEPIPVLYGNETRAGTSASNLERRTSPVPPPYPGTTGECVLAEVRNPARRSLAGYESTGGYTALRAALDRPPTAIVETLLQSGLAGRGGAGFPTGRKWAAVAEAKGHPKTIVCNADEGEPGCFKDRLLLDHDPHAVIEGMALAAHATGATLGFIYLRYEYPETAIILEQALREAEEKGYINQAALPTSRRFQIHLRRGAGAYICGEETSLLNSLEGKHPFPRNRPPFPVTHGYEDRPTVVNNVETLASVPPILRHGAMWYQGLGLGSHAGTKIISLSGDVKRPGNYEIPLGLPLKTLLYEWAHGPKDGHEFKAVTMAGLSGGFLSAKDFDVTLDEPCLRSRGSFLGAGGIMVFDDRRDMVSLAHQAMEFFAHESCGKCFPCRIGTQRLTERLEPGKIPLSPQAWTAEVEDIGRVMRATSACGLGQAAPLITQSLLKSFPEEVLAALRAENPMKEDRS